MASQRAKGQVGLLQLFFDLPTERGELFDPLGQTRKVPFYQFVHGAGLG